MHYLKYNFAYVPVHHFGYLHVGFDKTIIIDSLLVNHTLSTRKYIRKACYDQPYVIFCKLLVDISDSGSGVSILFGHEFMRCRLYKVIMEIQIADLNRI